MNLDPRKVILIPMNISEIIVTIHQLKTTWAEPANQADIINVTNKLEQALSESSKT